MIESNIIKRFVVKMFLQYNRLNLKEIAIKIMETLTHNFFMNESVIVKNTRRVGKICGSDKEKYIVLFGSNEKLEFNISELDRKNKVTFEDLTHFLKCVTQETPFGRILIENVLEKMTQPGFGENKEIKETPKCTTERKERHINKSQKETKRKEKKTKISRKDLNGQKNTLLITKNEQKKTEFKPEPSEDSEKRKIKKKKSELRIEDLEKFSIKNLKDNDLKNFIKIYQAVRIFKNEFGIEKVDKDALVHAIHDPEYNSDLIFKIHASFVTMIEQESKGDKFYEILGFIVKNLEDYEGETSHNVPKKKGSMNFENWKLHIKTFIINLSKEIDNDKILVFLDIFKKNSVSLRLRLLVFLLDVSTLTERFRSYVDIKQNNLRAQKSKYEKLLEAKKKLQTTSGDKKLKINQEIKTVEKEINFNALKLHVGKYKDNQIFILEKNFILKQNNDFYILKKDDVSCILNNLKLFHKQDKITSYNLKALYNIIFN